MDNNLKYTESIKYEITEGRFDTFGATETSEGVIFTVYVKDADTVELALFNVGEIKPFLILPYSEEQRIGDIYSMQIKGLDIEKFEYMYIKDKENYFLDTYAKEIRNKYTIEKKEKKVKKHYRGTVVKNIFNWEGVKQPKTPMSDLIIYELHTKGYTEEGTFKGLMNKIPYFKELGINAVELLPIFSFDSMLDSREYKGNGLVDYWGYNPINFFSPHKEYYESIAELKELIRELHRNGIEIILDVVYNHTAEGGAEGNEISKKVIDKEGHYILCENGFYLNYSGCGNTLNCNNPMMQRMILDSVRYWVTEFKIDGFRFDLASILTRDENGLPLSEPPIIKALAKDPILKDIKLIAEPWDTSMYQVGSFPSYGKWVEWNGIYRDTLRRVLKGDSGYGYGLGERINGSLDLYSRETREGASINFITCHDGFTLNDLYTYNNKYNEGNGWSSTDGENNNNSWNCGAEGDTNKKEVLELRNKMVKNALTVLLASRGTPMLLAGDEFRRTQKGNNNAYCQDNEISWVDWSLLNKHIDVYEYTKKMIKIRKEHPIMTKINGIAISGDYNSVTYHGVAPWYVGNWDVHKYIGIMFTGRNKSNTDDDFVYLAMNTGHMKKQIELPKLPEGYKWKLEITTDTKVSEEKESLIIPERTVCVCVSERVNSNNK